MEQILSILLPCCFGTRHARSPARSAADANERTPLLADGSQSIASGSGSIADSSAAQAKRKRKPQSILPTPAYDEHTLRNILDDLSARLVDVESAKTHADKQSILTSPPLATPEESTDKPGSGTGAKFVTPVHTLRLSVRSPSTPAEPTSKLVDIWPKDTEDAASVNSTAGARLSYSAALKRGAKKKAKRFPSTSNARPDDPAAVEQQTYNNLAQIAGSKPLVHSWDIDDTPDLHPPA